MWFWIIIGIVVLIVLSAMGKANEQQKIAQIEGRGPEKLASLFKEECPDFSGEITTGKCHSIMQRIIQDRKILLGHYKSDGKIKIRSLSFITEYQTNTLAPMLSAAFHETARQNPQDFYIRFERSCEIAIPSNV
jgi:hypothetical protein